MCGLALPNDFINELVLAEDLIHHNFDVMGSVPIAVIVEGACILENAVQFYATGPHEIDIGLRRCVPVLERASFFGLTPENFIISVGVKWRININQVNAFVR